MAQLDVPRRLGRLGRLLTGLAVVGAGLVVPLLGAAPASATTLQLTVLAPHDGKISSTPDESPPHHTPYDGDYSFDVAGTGDAYANLRNANGSVSLRVNAIGRACRSGSFADGGDKIVLDVLVNGERVGTITYAHLTDFSYGVGAGVPVGGRLGRPVTSGGNGCWTGAHVHVEPRNDKKFGCFFAGQLNRAANGGTALGIVGGELAGGKNVACGAGAEYTPPAPPPTAPATVGNGGSSITNPHSGKCLDVAGASSSSGTVVQLWDCNGQQAQQWLAYDGAFHVYGNYDKCLDADGGSIGGNGTRVQIWDCHGGDNQKWVSAADGTIRSVASGRCLDVPGAATATGTALQLYDCNASPAQTWVGQPRPNGGVPITGAASGRCVDVPGASIKPGTVLELWGCHGGANQQWLRSGSALVAYADKCMDVPGTTNGTRVTIWYCHGGANQQWAYPGDGTIRSVASGRCIDAEGGATGDGTDLQLWDCNGSAGQRFAFPAAAPPATVLPAALPAAVDRVAPLISMTGPTGRTAKGGVTVSWSATDVGSGVDHVSLRYRSKRTGGRWTALSVPAVWSRLTGSSVTAHLPRHVKVCFAAQAVDRAGNTSAWPAPACMRRR